MATKTARIDGEITESLGGLAVRATRLRGGLREGVLEIELVAGSNRVIRGGNWNNNASNCRSANRNNNNPTNRNNNNGFRIVRVLL